MANKSTTTNVVPDVSWMSKASSTAKASLGSIESTAVAISSLAESGAKASFGLHQLTVQRTAANLGVTEAKFLSDYTAFRKQLMN